MVLAEYEIEQKNLVISIIYSRTRAINTTSLTYVVRQVAYKSSLNLITSLELETSNLNVYVQIRHTYTLDLFVYCLAFIYDPFSIYLVNLTCSEILERFLDFLELWHKFTWTIVSRLRSLLLNIHTNSLKSATCWLLWTMRA